MPVKHTIWCWWSSTNRFHFCFLFAQFLRLMVYIAGNEHAYDKIKIPSQLFSGYIIHIFISRSKYNKWIGFNVWIERKSSAWHEVQSQGSILNKNIFEIMWLNVAYLLSVLYVRVCVDVLMSMGRLSMQLISNSNFSYVKQMIQTMHNYKYFVRIFNELINFVLFIIVIVVVFILVVGKGIFVCVDKRKSDSEQLVGDLLTLNRNN